MVCEPALAPGEPCLIARPLVRDALRMRRLSALARDLSAPCSIEQRETSKTFCRHGTPHVFVGWPQLARRIAGDGRLSPVACGSFAADPLSARSARADGSANLAPLEDA